MLSFENIESSGPKVVGLIVVLHVLDLAAVVERMVADVKTVERWKKYKYKYKLQVTSVQVQVITHRSGPDKFPYKWVDL